MKKADNTYLNVSIARLSANEVAIRLYGIGNLYIIRCGYFLCSLRNALSRIWRTRSRFKPMRSPISAMVRWSASMP